MNNDKWDRRMVGLAQYWAPHSTCFRRKVGAVLFQRDTYAVLSLGYNDTRIGATDCAAGGCPICADEATFDNAKTNLDCTCVHAEMNALLLSVLRPRGAHLAMWTDALHNPGPCASCQKHLGQAGVVGIYYYMGDRLQCLNL